MTQNSKPFKKKIIYIPIEDSYKDPAVDLLKLLNIFWSGKYFILSFCLICTVSAILICRYIIEPAYKASATISMRPDSITSIERYLRSTDFKQNLVARSEPEQHLEKRLASFLSNEDDFPFSFSAIRARQGFLDIFWVDEDPAIAAENLENATVEIEEYYKNNLTSQGQIMLNFLKVEIKDLKPIVDKIWQNYNETRSLTDFELVQRYFRLMDRKYGLEINDALAVRFKVVHKPVPPLNPFKPETKLIVILTVMFSFFISIACTLIYDSLKKTHKRQSGKQ